MLSPPASAPTPGTHSEAAEALAAAASEGKGVRFVGGATKLHWGRARELPEVELSTRRLDRIVEHNEGDLTAVLEAGVRLARAQEAFASAGQMLALDPPLGAGAGATVGGVLATGDSGPLRSRYGGGRDLVVGMAVALADGTVARAGGKVIKNVAGYDLAKLFCGSYGTLGLIVEVAVRLHPLPGELATVLGHADDPASVAGAASELAHAPLEYQCLDARWEQGRGSVLARLGGVAARQQAAAAERRLRETGLETDIRLEDEEVWARQREGQRSESGAIVRVSGLQSQLTDVLAIAERLDASVVGRAALGLSWLRIEDRSPEEAVAAVEEIRRALAPSPCAVLDAPDEVRRRADPWGELAGEELARRVKDRFDPAGACNPGALW